ncbi:hypothetical protein AKO1_012918 [Acrasis kona]|uniref:Uncharacterized protein n=1 Tax=Acrasis kona TaxID=1008807 RepID=A0AAW2YYM9_9EUKA
MRVVDGRVIDGFERAEIQPKIEALIGTWRIFSRTFTGDDEKAASGKIVIDKKLKGVFSWNDWKFKGRFTVRPKLQKTDDYPDAIYTFRVTKFEEGDMREIDEDLHCIYFKKGNNDVAEFEFDMGYMACCRDLMTFYCYKDKTTINLKEFGIGMSESEFLEQNKDVKVEDESKPESLTEEQFEKQYGRSRKEYEEECEEYVNKDDEDSYSELLSDDDDVKEEIDSDDEESNIKQETTSPEPPRKKRK